MTYSENWRKVHFAPLYEVSDLGRLRRARTFRPNDRPWRYIKPFVNYSGYWLYVLTDEGGKRHRYRAHRLVYEAFVGPLVDGMVICHIDGDPTNNTPSNLLQATQKQNMQHTRLHGTNPAGEKHGQATITESDVLAILKALQRAKYTPSGRLGRYEAKRLAAEFGVSGPMITKIKTGYRWRHVSL